MRTIVPAPRRVNPWAMGRYVGLALLALTPFALTGWAWWHVFTADMRPFNAANLCAGVVAFLSGVAALLGVGVGCFELADNWHRIARWWSEREAKWGEVEDR